MADELKGMDGVNLTAEEMKSEAQRQKESNDALASINLTKETLQNVTVGNAEKRRQDAIDAGKADQVATGGTLAQPNVVLKKEKRGFLAWLRGD